ncbi:hypothetical protein [Nocardioides bruguierae]|uniref:Uncharacterized protein n=1 Tax=Nocardioides bruguierae TaxID=2945102 RepID=A0A9X2DAR9_9ACTN|nr:hypothetical protein [Nocardioides bruguierae]MCM0622291.1 hypothetical protein [Nocardioides bruguierae]
MPGPRRSRLRRSLTVLVSVAMSTGLLLTTAPATQARTTTPVTIKDANNDVQGARNATQKDLADVRRIRYDLSSKGDLVVTTTFDAVAGTRSRYSQRLGLMLTTDESWGTLHVDAAAGTAKRAGIFKGCRVATSLSKKNLSVTIRVRKAASCLGADVVDGQGLGVIVRKGTSKRKATDTVVGPTSLALT